MLFLVGIAGAGRMFYWKKTFYILHVPGAAKQKNPRLPSLLRLCRFDFSGVPLHDIWVDNGGEESGMKVGNEDMT